MIDMDRQKAFALLGLPEDATNDEIESLVNQRRRKLRQSIVFASTAEQRQSSERALAELESAHIIVTLPEDNPESTLPAGSKIIFPTGQTLGDRYVIRRRIGYGESGAVFAALDLSWGKEIALKIIRPELLLVPGTYERLQATIKSIGELAHSGVVSVYGVSKLDGYVVIATELLPQKSLRSLLQDARTVESSGKRRSGVSTGHILDIVRELCAALDNARCKSLHLNLKPDNVIVSDAGFLKLTDFGLDAILGPALQITSPTAREQRRYRAPEQARQAETGSGGRTPIDERADQFSVAAIAHYLLLASAPYPDPSSMALRQMGIDKPVAEVLARALSSEPRERYATVHDFAQAFARASRKRPSQRAMAMTAGFLVSTLLLVSGAAVVMDRDNPISSFFAVVLKSVPGFAASPPQNAEVLQYQDKILALTKQLNGIQNSLRRDVIESRIELRTKIQAIDLAETELSREKAEQDFAIAELDFQRVAALRDVANPDIFNNPETLNAVNLISLANDHISNGRYLDARKVLTQAESVLVEKLRDYAQAEAMVKERFVPAESSPLDLNTAQRTTQLDQLRRDWQSASQTRRRFAAQVEARMVEIPQGSFQMGDTIGIGNQTEQPIRTVLVPAFQLSAFEVTISEFQDCVADGACSAPAGSISDQTPDAPVSGVSWIDAQDYLSWLSQKTGQEYRLPTEAEWEYAAKGTSGNPYPWGSNVGRGLANCVNCGSAWERVGVAPVASFAPSAFGLYDMAGNVWEWTADCWHPNYEGAPAIAMAREENALCADRVMRGGSWDNEAWLARTTYRGRGRADMRHDLYGFRVAKSLK